MSIVETNTFTSSNEETEKPISKYYVPKTKEECEICGAIYFQGYRNRHVQSQQHQTALTILRKYLERTFLKEIYRPHT